MKPVKKLIFILLALFSMQQLHALELSSPSAMKRSRLSDRFGKDGRVLTANQSPMFLWDLGGQTFNSFDLKLFVNNSAVVLPSGWYTSGSRLTTGGETTANDPFKFKIGSEASTEKPGEVLYNIFTSLGQGIPTTRDANGNNVPAASVTYTDKATLVLPAFYAGHAEGIQFNLDIQETDIDLNWVSTQVKLFAREVGSSESVLMKTDTYDTSFKGEVKYSLVMDSKGKALDDNKKYEYIIEVTTTKGGKDLPDGITIEAFFRKYGGDKADIKISNMVLKDSKSNVFSSSNKPEKTTLLEVHDIPGKINYLPEDVNALVTSGRLNYKNLDGTIIGTANIQNGPYYPMFDPYSGPDTRIDNDSISIKCVLTGHTTDGKEEVANLSLSYSSVNQTDVADPVVTKVVAPFPAVSRLDMEFTSDEVGIAYYVAIPKNEPATNLLPPANGTAQGQPVVVLKSDVKPSPIQIIAGLNSIYEPVVVRGQIAVKTGKNVLRLRGLDPTKEYEVYVAIRDSQGNIRAFSNRWFQMFCPSAIEESLPIFFGSDSAQGLNISPMLFWKGIPRNTHHFKLLLVNTDANNKKFWNVNNIPYDPITKKVTYLPEDLTKNPIDGVTFEGIGAEGKPFTTSVNTYLGPKSPSGVTQKYKFILSAHDANDKSVGSCDLTLNFTSRVEEDTLSPAVFGISTEEPLSTSKHTFSFISHESVTAYWVALESSAGVPTKAQIIGGLDSNYNSAVYKGSVKVKELAKATIDVQNLVEGKNYTVYVALRDETGNIVVITNTAVGLDFTPVSSEVISVDPLTVVAGKVITVRVKLTDKPLNNITIKPLPDSDVKYYTDGLTFTPENFDTPQNFTFVIRNFFSTVEEIKFGVSDGYSYIDPKNNKLEVVVKPVVIPSGSTHYNFQKGWNLIGVPYINMNRDDLGYGAAAGTELADLWTKINSIFQYSVATGSYVNIVNNLESPMTSRRGYWVYINNHLKNPNVIVSGVRDTQPIIEFKRPYFGIRQDKFNGWVLLSVSQNYKAGQIYDKLGSIWKWDQYEQSYVEVVDTETLIPGVGYWVFSYAYK